MSDVIYQLTGKDYFPVQCLCGKEKNDLCRCTLLRDGALGLDIGSLQISQSGSSISGYYAGEFPLLQASYGLVLCDGMSTGKAARESAKHTVELVRNMLQCGFEKEFTVEMVDYLTMMDRDNEVYTTMD